MKAAHTPGPWRVGFGKVYPKEMPQFATMAVSVYGDYPQNGFGDSPIASIAPVKDYTPIDHANAARIVECVNACEGIENPADLRKQRDELLKALGLALEIIEKPGISASHYSENMHAIECAIAITKPQ